MSRAIVFKPKTRPTMPKIFMCDIEKDVANNDVRHLFRSDFIGTMQPEILEKVFPPDSSLHGIDVEFFHDYIIIRPIGMPSISINGIVLEDEHYYAVNIGAHDILVLGNGEFAQEFDMTATFDC